MTRDALESICERSRGDIRGALNDLDAVAPLPPGPLQAQALIARRSTHRFLPVHGGCPAPSSVLPFRGGPQPDRRIAGRSASLDRGERTRIASNATELDDGIAVVARAERFLALARRARVWALWSFASELMTGGAGLALGGTPRDPAQVSLAFPRFLSDMGRSRWSRATRLGIVQKIAHHSHTSRAKAGEYLFPYVEEVFRRRPPPARQGLVREQQRSYVSAFELTREEIAFLMDRIAGIGGGRPELSRPRSWRPRPLHPRPPERTRPNHRLRPPRPRARRARASGRPIRRHGPGEPKNVSPSSDRAWPRGHGTRGLGRDGLEPRRPAANVFVIRLRIPPFRTSRFKDPGKWSIPSSGFDGREAGRRGSGRTRSPIGRSRDRSLARSSWSHRLQRSAQGPPCAPRVVDPRAPKAREGWARPSRERRVRRYRGPVGDPRTAIGTAAIPGGLHRTGPHDPARGDPGRARRPLVRFVALGGGSTNAPETRGSYGPSATAVPM